MKKNTLIIVLTVIALGLAGYAAYLSYQTTKIIQPIAMPIIEDIKTLDNSSLNSSNIHIFSPIQGDTITSPVKISGEVRVFENQFNIRIKDATGKVLVEESAMGGNGDMGQFNPFEKEVAYTKSSTAEGTIEIFDYSAKDGSEIDKVIIPVKFESELSTLDIQSFFGNTKMDPKTTDCKTVYPVVRKIAHTNETARAAIEELLKGPTKDELALGYFTSINSGVQLKSINIVKGIATVDFNQALQAGVGGSCKVANIRSQITEAIKQFGTVNSVVISIDGQTEDILQP